MTTYVYILNIESANAHLVMASLSIRSLRAAQKDSKIILVSDPVSKDVIRNNSHLDKVVDEFILAETDGLSGIALNRYIKTSLSNLIAGDFCYLDCDTIVRRSLEDAWDYDFDIAGVRTMNSTGPSFTRFALERFAKWGVSPPKNGLVNGGVLFVRNNDNAKLFFEQYRFNWEDYYQKIGAYNDEQALSFTADRFGGHFRYLPDEYNAQEIFRPCTLKNARVWHFFHSLVRNEGELTLWERELGTWQNAYEKSKVNWSELEHPYLCVGLASRFAVKSMLKDPNIVPRHDLRRAIVRNGLTLALKQRLFRYFQKIAHR